MSPAPSSRRRSRRARRRRPTSVTHATTAHATIATAHATASSVPRRPKAAGDTNAVVGAAAAPTALRDDRSQDRPRRPVRDEELPPPETDEHFSVVEQSETFDDLFVQTESDQVAARELDQDLDRSDIESEEIETGEIETGDVERSSSRPARTDDQGDRRPRGRRRRRGRGGRRSESSEGRSEGRGDRPARPAPRSEEESSPAGGDIEEFDVAPFADEDEPSPLSEAESLDRERSADEAEPASRSDDVPAAAVVVAVAAVVATVTAPRVIQPAPLVAMKRATVNRSRPSPCTIVRRASKTAATWNSTTICLPPPMTPTTTPTSPTAISRPKLRTTFRIGKKPSA